MTQQATMPKLAAVNTLIVQAFYPKPICCEINGKTYWIERITAGWCWRNEDGEMQEDFDIAPFATACEAQADAIRHASEIQCPTCGDHHRSDEVPFGCETGDGV